MTTESAVEVEAVPLTYSVPEAGKMLSPPLSKNAAYRAAERGEIPTLRFGHLLRVPGKKWLRMLAGEAPNASAA